MSASNRVQDGIATITMTGRFDFSVHAEFKASSEAVFVHRDIKQLDVNISQVDYVDSSALGMLLVLKDRATAAGVKTTSLVGARGLVKQILDVAHFEKFFTLR